MLRHSILLLLLLAGLSIPSQAELPSLDRWQVLHARGFELAGSSVKIKTSEKGAYLVSPPVSINSERIYTCTIKIKSGITGAAWIYWINSYSHDYDQQKSVQFNLKKSDGFKTYVFNLKKRNPNWKGFTSQMLIAMPPEAGEVEVSQIELASGSFTSDLTAGVQEFTGPQGREVIGSTINNIKSSTVLGVPVNVYLYIIILIGALVIFIVDMRTGFTRANYYRSVGHIFFLTFACWVLLDANTLFNQIGIFKQDASTYFGKSLRDKRASIPLMRKGLYPFLEFCEEKIPAGASYKIIGEFGSYESLYPPFYLYPRQSSEEPEYVIVYHPKEKPDLPGATMAASFKDGEYILKIKRKGNK
ncbi:MAG: hypothetical protein KKH83_03600 [Candidatus Margulisbacteria bacterium]|nr:hypothetical protein [Candidatus Margulisiibacteriota bacterium]